MNGTCSFTCQISRLILLRRFLSPTIKLSWFCSVKRPPIMKLLGRLQLLRQWYSYSFPTLGVNKKKQINKQTKTNITKIISTSALLLSPSEFQGSWRTRTDQEDEIFLLPLSKANYLRTKKSLQSLKWKQNHTLSRPFKLNLFENVRFLCQRGMFRFRVMDKTQATDFKGKLVRVSQETTNFFLFLFYSCLFFISTRVLAFYYILMNIKYSDKPV